MLAYTRINGNTLPTALSVLVVMLDKKGAQIPSLPGLALHLLV